MWNVTQTVWSFVFQIKCDRVIQVERMPYLRSQQQGKAIVFRTELQLIAAVLIAMIETCCSSYVASFLVRFKRNDLCPLFEISSMSIVSIFGIATIVKSNGYQRQWPLICLTITPLIGRNEMQPVCQSKKVMSKEASSLYSRYWHDLGDSFL